MKKITIALSCLLLTACASVETSEEKHEKIENNIYTTFNITKHSTDLWSHTIISSDDNIENYYSIYYAVKLGSTKVEYYDFYSEYSLNKKIVVYVYRGQKNGQ